MATELEFRIQVLARERAVLLLSKASGVSLEFLQTLETPITSEECTPEFLGDLVKLSEALDIVVLDLLVSDESRTALIDRIIEFMQQAGVNLPFEPDVNLPGEKPEGPDGEAPAAGGGEQVDEFHTNLK